MIILIGINLFHGYCVPTVAVDTSIESLGKIDGVGVVEGITVVALLGVIVGVCANAREVVRDWSTINPQNKNNTPRIILFFLLIVTSIQNYPQH